jgi:hypothetical protein
VIFTVETPSSTIGATVFRIAAFKTPRRLQVLSLTRWHLPGQNIPEISHATAFHARDRKWKLPIDLAKQRRTQAFIFVRILWETQMPGWNAVNLQFQMVSARRHKRGSAMLFGDRLQLVWPWLHTCRLLLTQLCDLAPLQ